MNKCINTLHFIEYVLSQIHASRSDRFLLVVIYLQSMASLRETLLSSLWESPGSRTGRKRSIVPESGAVEVARSIVVATCEDEIGIENRIGVSVDDENRLGQRVRPITELLLLGISVDFQVNAVRDGVGELRSVHCLIDEELRVVDDVDEALLVHRTTVDRLDSYGLGDGLIPGIETRDVTRSRRRQQRGSIEIVRFSQVAVDNRSD